MTQVYTIYRYGVMPTYVPLCVEPGVDADPAHALMKNAFPDYETIPVTSDYDDDVGRETHEWAKKWGDRFYEAKTCLGSATLSAAFIRKWRTAK